MILTFEVATPNSSLSSKFESKSGSAEGSRAYFMITSILAVSSLDSRTATRAFWENGYTKIQQSNRIVPRTTVPYQLKRWPEDATTIIQHASGVSIPSLPAVNNPGTVEAMRMSTIDQLTADFPSLVTSRIW